MSPTREALRGDPNRASLLVFALAAAVAAVMVLVYARGTTFALDEWRFVFEDSSIRTLLRPENGHLIVLPVAIYKALLGVFGASSYLPFRLYSIVLTVLVAGLVYAIGRPRIGPWLSLAPALLLLFYGAGWEVEMNPATVQNQLCLAAGLGMLVVLDRGDMKGDAAACALLACSVASFTVGLAFAVAAAVEIAIRPGDALARRWWVFGIPILLYAAWFIWASQFHDSTIVGSSVGSVVSGGAEQLAAIFVGLTGLFRDPTASTYLAKLTFPYYWGIPFALGLVVVVGARLRSTPPPSPRLVTLVFLTLAYLTLIALGLSAIRSPEAPRYVWMGSVIVLILLIEVAAGLRLSTFVKTCVWAALGLSLVGNVAELHTAGLFFRGESEYNRAELGALEVVRPNADPATLIESPSTAFYPHFDLGYSASMYFDAVDRYGSPADSEAELRTAPEGPREQADQTMARALGISAAPIAGLTVPRTGPGVGLLGAAQGEARRRGRCVALRPDRGKDAQLYLVVPPGGLAYAPQRGPAPSLALRRFGSRFTVEVAAPRGAARVEIPSDSSLQPWIAQLKSSLPVTTCPLR